MDEKLRILKMVEEGKITAEEAMELITALGAEQEPQNFRMVRSGYDKKMFRIVVDSVGGDKANVQFPVGGIKKILKATGKLPIPDENLKGVDIGAMIDGICECLDDEIEGDLVNVTAADGTTVRVFVDK